MFAPSANIDTHSNLTGCVARTALDWRAPSEAASQMTHTSSRLRPKDYHADACLWMAIFALFSYDLEGIPEAAPDPLETFYWQLHHENNKPKYTLADKLRIVSYRTNERERTRSNKNNSLHASSDDALHSE